MGDDLPGSTNLSRSLGRSVVENDYVVSVLVDPKAFPDLTRVVFRPDDDRGSSVDVWSMAGVLTSQDADSWIRSWGEMPLFYATCTYLFFVTEGCYTINIEGREISYLPGSALLLGKNVRYRIETTTAYTCLCLSLPDAFYTRALADGLEGLEAHEGLPPEVATHAKALASNDFEGYFDFFPHSLESEEGKIAHRDLLELADALAQKRLGVESHMSYLLADIMECLLLSGEFDVHHVMPQTKIDRLIFNRIQRLIELNDGNIRRKQLTELLHYSSSYIDKLVRRYADARLFDYCMTYTMRSAAKRLTETDEPVAAITESLGFNNRTHFNRLFKRAYGMTPSAYRKAAGKG